MQVLTGQTWKRRPKKADDSHAMEVEILSASLRSVRFRILRPSRKAGNIEYLDKPHFFREYYLAKG